ncbi:MAG: TonB-dependent receptor, partial [Flavobacteriaceae bacterium]
STGLLNDHFELSGRLSKIISDGYVDRAASNLKSYFLQGAFKDNNTLIKALAFGGHEITYQSWYGIDKVTLAENRTYNPAGSIYDNSGSLMGYYDQQEDNYRQDHYQFHWTQQLEANWNLSLGLNYTYGRGYYEEYNDLWDDQNLSFSGATQFSYLQLPNYTLGNTTISTSENVTRKWLDNDYYVGTLSVNHNTSKATLNFGLLASRYIGDHFGTLIWGELLRNVSPRHRFYENVGRKNEASAFAKGTYDFNTQWSGYLDLQWRSLSYTVEGEVKGPAAFNVDERYSFFNPKAGVVFTPNAQQQLYFSFARAHREPNRTDFENGAPKPEQLNDFELGWRWNSSALQFQANAYYMAYKDQLVLTGALDEVGSPIRENVGKSRRYGIELEAKLPFASQWLWMPNLTWSRNENQDFFFQSDGNLQNLGNTKLSYSPEIIATNAVVYAPSTNVQLALLTKHVGEQYMGNIDAEKSLLAAYTVTDFNLRYVHNPEEQFFKQLEWSLLLNNLFNASYVSNGYFYTYDDTWSAPGTTTTIEGAGYYPQAGRNLLLGLSIQF